MCFENAESKRRYHESNREALAKFQEWDRIDISRANADWAMRPPARRRRSRRRGPTRADA